MEDFYLVFMSLLDIFKINGENFGDEKRLVREDSGKLFFESEEDEIVEDDFFSLCWDFFSVYFYKLVLDFKVSNFILFLVVFFI